MCKHLKSLHITLGAAFSLGAIPAPAASTLLLESGCPVHRILCVDDEPASLRTLLRSLSRLGGLQIDTAQSPEEARTLAVRHEYSVILTDYNMPTGTGVELLESLSALGCRALPLLVTGQTDMDTALAAVNRGHIHGLIHKPWRAPELTLMVQRACERYELNEQLRRKVLELEQANADLRARNEALEAAQASIRQLTEVAATDDKTGARTHRFFTERLAEELARAKRYERPLALMLLISMASRMSTTSMVMSLAIVCCGELQTSSRAAFA